MSTTTGANWSGWSPPYPLLVPARLRRADPAELADALDRLRAGGDERADLKLVVKHVLAVLEQKAPGHSVEVRVPACATPGAPRRPWWRPTPGR